MSSRSINNHHKQAGAIGLWGALTLLMAILFMALAVDTGRLYLQQRKLQSVADMAAMSAAQRIGCFPDVAAATASAQAAATQNGFQGTLETVELGSINKVNGINHFARTGQQAVRVVAAQSVPSSLVAGGFLQGQTVLRAEAVSEAAASTAAFSIGSTLVNLNTSDAALLNNLLGKLLGSPVNLSVLSYQGLASANVTLQNLLKAQGQAGSLNQLLGETIPLDEMFTMLGSAIQLGGGNAEAAITLQQLANATSAGGNARLADLLAITSSAEAASDVGINVLALVNTLAIAANGTHALSLPVAVNLPQIANVNATVQFLQPPQLAVGYAGGCTFARTAQIEVRAGTVVSIPLLAKVDVMLKLNVAQGEAVLDDISDDGTNANVTISTNSGVASLEITNSAGSGDALISALNIPIASISSNVPAQRSAANRLEFNVTHPVSRTLPIAQTDADASKISLADTLNQSTSLDVKVLGSSGLVGSVISTIVRPLLVAIAQNLLDPLLQMLGIQLGTVDVTLQGVSLRPKRALAI